jgi:hypothetical protein
MHIAMLHGNPASSILRQRTSEDRRRELNHFIAGRS